MSATDELRRLLDERGVEWEDDSPACTPEEMLRPSTEEEIAKAMPDLGHHRFDESCPEYGPDACVGCRHDRSD